MKHTKLLISLIAALGITFASQAQAQAQAPSGYPNKTIRMILPLAVGSAVDVAARLLAQKMSANMGQSIVIENVTGAAGIIGADKLAKAAPDGYTIGGFNDSVVTMVPNLNPNTPYNPLKDFTFVSLVATVEFCLAVPPDSPFKTTADLIAAAKKAPDSIAFASGGNGSPQHIGFAMFNSQTNTVMKHIPYKGASQAAQDVASGQVPVTMQGIATVAGLVKGGKLRLMGVSMKQRHPQFPDIPTISESGAPGFEFSTWFLVTAPAGTPKEIVTRLNREIVKALADPELRERYETLGLAPLGTSPEELATRTQQQFAKYAKVIKDNQIRSD